MEESLPRGLIGSHRDATVWTGVERIKWIAHVDGKNKEKLIGIQNVLGNKRNARQKEMRYNWTSRRDH